jgi:hypothetical protein
MLDYVKNNVYAETQDDTSQKNSTPYMIFSQVLQALPVKQGPVRR